MSILTNDDEYDHDDNDDDLRSVYFARLRAPCGANKLHQYFHIIHRLQ